MSHLLRIFLAVSAVFSMMAGPTTADDPFPLFSGYPDFEQRHSQYNRSYWIDVAYMKKGCICEGQSVVCYDEDQHYITKQLIRDDLNTEKTYKVETDLDCLTCLVQESVYFGYCMPNNKIPVKEYESKSLVSSKSLQREEIRTESFWISNAGSSEQVQDTNEYETTVMNTDELEFDFAASLSSKVEVSFPMMGSAEMRWEISAGMKTKHTTSESRRMKIPSKKITVPPHSRVNYTWTLFSAKREFRFGFNFEIDGQGEDSINVDYSELKKKLLAQKVYANLSPRNDPFQVGIVLRSGGNLVAENIPVKETRKGHETSVYISDEQPLP